MQDATSWRDVLYTKTFEAEIRGLERRRAYDPSCSIEDLRATLQHLYHMEGADWGGRGELQDIVLRATIAAYEQVIAEWEVALKRKEE
ncbi:MAG: hypothetical protein WHT84_01525 [Breznakiellaceae bacterium]